MNKKALRRYLRGVLESICDPSKVEPDRHRAVMIFGGDETVMTMQQEGEPSFTILQDPKVRIGPSFAIVDDGCKALTQYVSEIDSDPEFHGKLGKEIQDYFVACVREVRIDEEINDSTLDAAIESQIVKLRAAIQPWTSICPIDNLRFKDFSVLRIGNVTFQSFLDVRQRVLDELDQRIDRNPTSSDEKQKLKALLAQQLDQNYGSNIIAETVVEASASRQQQIAYSEIDASLNVLRCFTHLLFPWDSVAKLGMRGQISFVPRPSIGLAHSDPSWTFYFEKIGTALPYTLTKESVEIFKRDFSLDILSRTIAKPQNEQTKLEQAVVTSVRWLGRGVDSLDAPEKVLNFAAATERLLIGDDENKTEIAERFTRRLAFLVANDPDQRLRVGQRSRELYKVRNNVIHAGRTDIEFGDVCEMEFFAVRALIQIAARLHEWKTHKQFANWVEAQIYKTAGDSDTSTV